VADFEEKGKFKNTISKEHNNQGALFVNKQHDGISACILIVKLCPRKVY
jgi:hypothetical protein